MDEIVDQQADPPATPGATRRRFARGLPDLGALLEDVDNNLEGTARIQNLASGEPAQESAVSTQSITPEAETPVLPAVRRNPKPQTLLSILDEPKTAPPAPSEKRLAALAGLGSTEEEGDQDGSGNLLIPAELQAYLSPDLWRRLNGATPQRGVLINALERIRSILYLISTFIPAHLVQEKMRRPVTGLVSGQILAGSMLFSDVSGFTSLSEKLAALGSEGAERLTKVMNQYFAEMLEILSWSGGVLLKFAGDATLVYFPAQEHGQHAHWAVRAAQRMQQAMSRLGQVDSPGGKTQLAMKIGIASGDFLAASIGSVQRMEYAVLGQAVSQTMLAESLSTGAGQIIIDDPTAQILGPGTPLIRLKNGFSRLQAQVETSLDTFEIKAETRRARGAIPWSASPQAILAQISVALRQVQSLSPYLAPELVEKIIAHARQRHVTSQYRPTTVMFINFWGVEGLLERWGEAGTQRVTSVLNAYFTRMHAVITRYGGMISRIDPYSRGTKMLVLFGAPVAHEDDPQRAVSAALAMNGELELLNESWRKKFARYLPLALNSPLVQHRIGITTGETFAGQVGSSTRREYTVMGDEVNLAARLMGAAEAGRLFVSQQVNQAVQDYFLLTARPAIRLKGKSKPVPIFQVEGPLDDTLTRRARNRQGLVGREEELSRSRTILQAATRGQGATLILQGPAGIGKSHLADILLNQFSELGAQIQSVQCHSYTMEMPFASWGALLRSMAQITTLDYQPEIIQNKLTRLLGTLEISTSLTPPLSALIGAQRSPTTSETEMHAEKQLGTPQDEAGALAGIVREGRVKRKGSSLDLFEQLERQSISSSGQSWRQMPAELEPRERNELYEAVMAVLARSAASAPLMIFFEDAHWMDAQSLDLLNYAAQRIRNTPLVLLLAQREAEHPPDKTATLIELQPLKPQDTTALVAALLVSDLAQVIHEQSGGNPLFVDEITRWFKRTRNLSAAELKGVLQSSGILQKLVLSSIENLPETQREIIQAASVIGNEFRTGEVRALLSDEMDNVTLSNHLRGLARERLIELTEAGADARYAFQQSLVRDILYGSLPFEKRRELHARLANYLSMPLSQRRKVHALIAAALDASATIDTSQGTELIAQHYEQAGRWLEAAKNYHTAGGLARAAKSRQKALELYGRSIAALNNLPEEEGGEQVRSIKRECLTRQGELAALAGDFLLSVSSLESALSALPPGASLSERREITNKLALVLPLQNRSTDAIKLMHQMLEQSEQPQDLLTTLTLAWLYRHANASQSEEWIMRGKQLAIEQPASAAPVVACFLDELNGDLEMAAEKYIALNRVSGAAAIEIRLGEQELNAQHFSDALDHYRRAEQLWRNEVPEWNGLALALFRQAEVYFRTNQQEQARSHLEEAQKALAPGAPLLKPEGQVAIQQALRLIAKGGKGQWPIFAWQVYQDAFHATALLA